MSKGFSGKVASVFLAFVILVSLVMSSMVFAAEDNAMTATASSTSAPDYAPAEAIDGITDDPENLWCAAGEAVPQWLMVDLGDVYDVSAVEAILYDADTEWKYKIEGSTDGENWTMLADKTADGIKVANMKETVSGQHRYIKITITYVGGGHWAALKEVMITKSKPGAADNSAADSTSSPATGDESNVFYAMGWMIVSAIALFITRRKVIRSER